MSPRKSLLYLMMMVFAGSVSCLPHTTAAGDEPQIVYLHTEFIPYQHSIEKQISYRLMRELVRQAFVVAAQDELGVVIRDGSLYETVPTGDNVKHLAVLERASLSNHWQVKLFEIDDPSTNAPARGLWNDKPVWEKTYKYRAAGSQMYAPLTIMYEEASRNDFVDALRAAGVERQHETGVERQHKAAEADAAPSAQQLEKWDRGLLAVDAATQFGVLRDIHRSMRHSGESVAHLERLCRGYANLSVLTQHQWNSTYEVFGARSWIYGQRILQQSDDADRAGVHQAYAFALVGAHNHALNTIKSMAERRLLETPAESDQWMRLIQPYLDCDRAAVKQVGADHESLEPLAKFLWFQLTAAYRIPQWIKSSGLEVLEVAPAAYGVYEMMARCGNYLGIQRYGANMAMPALSQNVHSSLESVIDIPQSVLAEPGLRGILRKDVLPRDLGFRSFSPVPKFAANRLRSEAAKDLQTNLSWSVLATLLEDEQFASIVNALVDSTNAVEHSQADVVEKLMPLVEGHRYAAIVQSFQYDRFREFDKIIEAIAEMELHDPRPNMGSLMDYYFRIQKAKGGQIEPGMMPTRNFTMQGLLEQITHAAKSPGSLIVANEFRKIVPNHELVVRWAILTDEEPTVEKLQKWEQKLRDDPISFRLIGQRYHSLKDAENSVRCYKRSMELLPTYETASALASHYKGTDQNEKWEQVLLDYLETEDLGLEHAGARRQLVDGLASQGRWQDAKQHAILAAQTYQAASMSVASEVLEALAEWDQSEQWIQRLAQSYPSTSGYQWYYWCRRTGRGDLETARQLAIQSFQASKLKTSHSHACFLVMEGQPEAAIAMIRRLEKKQSYDSQVLMLHDLHLEVGDEKKAAETLANLRQRTRARVAREKWKNPEYGSIDDDAPPVPLVTLALTYLIESGEPEPAAIAKLDRQIESTDGKTQSIRWYLLAQHLARSEKEDQAISYWKKSLNAFQGHGRYSTLSGWELSKRLGTSRADESSRDEIDL